VAARQSDPMAPLRVSYERFVDCVRSIPEPRFLSPMNGWTPRDVVAHLIGWSRALAQAGVSIIAGELPTYYADAPNDYRNINAVFVMHYASTSREDLLGELASAIDDLAAFVVGLSKAQLTEDHRLMHYSGEPATVQKIIRSLTGEFAHHRGEIGAWLEST